jgi:hypothetical protein
MRVDSTQGPDHAQISTWPNPTPPYPAHVELKTSQSQGKPEIALEARRWVGQWAETGPLLERIRNEELRELDSSSAIALLCGEADYHTISFAPEPYSGLVEQQRLFANMAPRT